MRRAHTTVHPRGASVIVGACRVTLALPGNASLKGKRAAVRPILERVRARFNVAAAEVANQDDHVRATLGFAVVSSSRSHAESMIDTIVDFVERDGRAILVGRERELVAIGTFGDE